VKKLILITGASQGIGREISFQLAKEGHDLILVSRNLSKLLKVKKEISGFGTNCYLFSCDLTKKSQIQSLHKKLKKQRLWPSDIINNAGIGGAFKKIENLNITEWDSIISLNLTSVFLLLKNFIPKMKENKKGSIINIASIYGIIGGENSVAYSTTKHGLVGLTKSLALELLNYNIKCNAILPGFIKTPMIKTKQHTKIVGSKGKAFLGTPSDVANLVIFLLSENSRHINGTTLVLDGGMLAGIKIS